MIAITKRNLRTYFVCTAFITKKISNTNSIAEKIISVNDNKALTTAPLSVIRENASISALQSKFSNRIVTIIIDIIKAIDEMTYQKAAQTVLDNNSCVELTGKVCVR